MGHPNPIPGSAVKDAPSPWTRRRLLGGAAALGTAAALTALGMRNTARAEERGHAATGGHGGGRSLPFDPQACLRSFERGLVIQENGRPVRLFEVEARSINVPLAADLLFKAWTLNGRIPGPSLRARQGERIRVVFRNADSTAHSLHFHGVHPAAMDGIDPILPGRTAVYEFDLDRAGLFPYHCHVAPVSRHVGKGLFGLLVVDPPADRPPADELVLVMGGYDINNDGRNELYAFNGIPDAYMLHPIQVRQNALVRIYLLNMTELESPLTFHTHANQFTVVSAGAQEPTDVITLGVAERKILELRYPFPGRYMFHPHQDQIAERGAMGFFEVMPA
jgi:FtsP/CotA-like multicopper oxidase with cupredoxin domain